MPSTWPSRASLYFTDSRRIQLTIVYPVMKKLSQARHLRRLETYPDEVDTLTSSFNAAVTEIIAISQCT